VLKSNVNIFVTFGLGLEYPQISLNPFALVFSGVLKPLRNFKWGFHTHMRPATGFLKAASPVVTDKIVK
jgi:hypothetical protein